MYVWSSLGDRALEVGIGYVAAMVRHADVVNGYTIPKQEMTW